MKSDKIQEIQKRVNDTMENSWPQLPRKSIKAPLNVVEAQELLGELTQLTRYKAVVEAARNTARWLRRMERSRAATDGG